MRFIKKNIIWIALGAFLVYKFWDKIGPMLGMGGGETAKSLENESELVDPLV